MANVMYGKMCTTKWSTKFLSAAWAIVQWGMWNFTFVADQSFAMFENLGLAWWVSIMVHIYTEQSAFWRVIQTPVCGSWKQLLTNVLKCLITWDLHGGFITYNKAQQRAFWISVIQTLVWEVQAVADQSFETLQCSRDRNSLLSIWIAMSAESNSLIFTRWLYKIPLSHKPKFQEILYIFGFKYHMCFGNLKRVTTLLVMEAWHSIPILYLDYEIS